MSSRIIAIDSAAVAEHSHRMLFTSEPACCGGRLDPAQTVIPPWLAAQLDHHVWPSLAPQATTAQARAVCEHIDWEGIWREDPELWTRRHTIGAPTPATLFSARAELREHGHRLCLDVEVHTVYAQLALVIYGAGVLGRLSDAAWEVAAPLLTTCASMVREPRPDTPHGGWLRPARPSIAAGRALTSGVVLPAHAWRVGDWLHTWWSYLDGPLRARCACPAHEAHTADFGPGTSAGSGHPADPEGTVTPATHTE